MNELVKNDMIKNAGKLNIIPEQLMRMDKVIQELFVNQKECQTIILKIKRHGSLIFEGVYGTNTKPHALSTDTIFCVQSITKPIIANLLLILQEEGLVDVNDPVKCYLPEFNGGGKENIHLWHFLTHTSGYNYSEINAYMEKTLLEKYNIPTPSRKAPRSEWDDYHCLISEKLGMGIDEVKENIFYRFMLEMPLPRKPHKEMSYFGLGFEKIKQIIEKQSGESIDEYARKRLFAPLGMNDTYWDVPKDKWNRIIGRADGSLSSEWLNSEESYVSDNGAGGLKSTAEDMLRYCEMVRNEGRLGDVRVMSKASVRAMVSDHNESIEDEWEWGSWSLGWNYHGNKKDDSSILRSPTAVCHNGGGATKIYIDKEYGITMTLFSVAMKNSEINVIGRILNMLYAALD
jgi:CubicO group peptidase (beta-lactamase class C family)